MGADWFKLDCCYLCVIHREELMQRTTFLVVLAFVAFQITLSAYVPAAAADGFTPLFNGKDLSGWARVNCAPETFFVRNGMIVTTGVPMGILRSEKQYENFIIELEWKHLKEKGNSGLFIWADALPAT